MDYSAKKRFLNRSIVSSSPLGLYNIADIWYFYEKGVKLMKFYQIDSFTDRLFRGNPAGVCLVYDNWPDEALMQSIAAEANLSETVFVLEAGRRLHLRWFTPTVEVDLCGHATLAAAYVLFEYEGYEGVIEFSSKMHELRVTREGELLVLDFPIAEIWRIEADAVPDCFNFKPAQHWRSRDEYLLVFESQAQIEGAVCDLKKAADIELSGFIITAPASSAGLDFVSRYFAPKIGIDEDPVTGSAHTILMPYWRNVFGKDELEAAQLSRRGGRLSCRVEGNRVKIAGRAVTFLAGEILGC